MASESRNRILLSFSFFILLMGRSSYSRTLDKLLQGQELKDGDELVSALGTFRLGFFSPLSSTKRYLGIWYFLPAEGSKDVHYHVADGYYQKDKPQWVANRDYPISNKSGKLTINSDGNLIILSDGGGPIPISSVQRGSNTSATLLQSGNLVLQEMNSKRILWQSFDPPTDTLLPGMKQGINLQTRQTALCSRSADEYVNHWLARRGFMSEKGIKIDQSDNMNFSDCQAHCIKNCSCVAFAPTANNNFTGCEIWSNGTEYKKCFRRDARFLFLLDEVFDFQAQNKKKKKKETIARLEIEIVGPLLLVFFTTISYLLRRKYKEKEEKWWMSLIIAIGVPFLITPLCYLYYWISRKLKENYNRKKLLRELASTLSHHRNFGRRKRKTKKSMIEELRLFNFQTIEAATSNFSNANKIGEGGFGPVYKGSLEDGQVIAVKRLSARSRQGIREFKNEVKLIAKLQHTNLVKLLGCSLRGEERVLVYEHMPNRSLDFYIFDSERKKLFNWKIRFNVIEGIAQGLLYLHKYSRLKVIHRDLKTSNILLDDEMNPKISDFGMARIFGVKESETNTKRIVGTYGYMSPEYAMSGIVSIKTDVYSFGVLVLEIVSSKKNTCSYHLQRPLNLIGYAWQLWNENRALDLIDPEMDGPSSPDQALRCIHVALLCVQDQAADRPPMSDIICMLKTSETRNLPAPKQPAFYINVHPGRPEVPENDHPENLSVNEVTITMILGR